MICGAKQEVWRHSSRAKKPVQEYGGQWSGQRYIVLKCSGLFFCFFYTYFKPIVSITSFSTDHCINLANSC